jgi:hypothetical protein
MLPASIIGVLTFIGIYVVQAIAMMASVRFSLQLYELYLERGGEPIPLKPLPTAAPQTPGLPPQWD